jgi:hypothetical protein
MAPEFAEHAGSVRASAERQAELERMIAKAEYECCQLRRELVGLMPELALPADASPSRGAIEPGTTTSAAEAGRRPAVAA